MTAVLLAAVTVASVLAGCTPAPVNGPAVPPEVSSLHPADGSQVCARPEVGADLLLTDATRKDGAFDPSTVTLSLDGKDATLAAAIREALTTPASRVTLLYTPDANLPLGEHRALLTLLTATGSATVTWHFTVVDVPCGQ